MNISRVFLLMVFIICLGSFEGNAQLPHITAEFNTYEPVIPGSPFRLDTLFFEDLSTTYNVDGIPSPAKGKHDYVGITKQNPFVYNLYISHEISNEADSILGDGGGVTAFKVAYNPTDSGWAVEDRGGGRKFFALDFEPVGGTNRNCGGAMTPKGKLLTAEEDFPDDNEDIYDGGTGIQDTSDWVIPPGNGLFSGQVLKRYENLGWMSEIDPKNGEVLHKLYAMGRFKHESAICAPNGRTVFLIEDNFPSCIYKFEADSPHDYRSGQLYAYQQFDLGGGTWLELPRSLDSLKNVHKWALKKGATLFLNLEWITNVPGFNDKLFISESGRDFAPIRFAINQGGKLAKHLVTFDTLYGGAADSSLIDYYGRILAFDLDNNNIEVYLEGGTAQGDSTLNLSNPDAITGVRIAGNQYLCIQEDINGYSHNRMPAGSLQFNNVCEVYMLPLTGSPTLDDLKRVFIGPRGAELAGAVFTADGNTMFINIQHPFDDNTPPYHKSATVAVTGFKEHLLAAMKASEQSFSPSTFVLRPNPTMGMLYFNEVANVEIYDLRGKLVKSCKQQSSIDLSMLPAGHYIVKSGEEEQLVELAH